MWCGGTGAIARNLIKYNLKLVDSHCDKPLRENVINNDSNYPLRLFRGRTSDFVKNLSVVSRLLNFSLQGNLGIELGWFSCTGQDPANWDRHSLDP